jgi:hypothetical protein
MEETKMTNKEKKDCAVNLADGAERALEDREDPIDTATMVFDDFDDLEESTQDEILDYISGLKLIALDKEDINLIKEKLPELFEKIKERVE